MSKISVELIPRNKETLEEEVKLIKDLAPLVNTINIPDLLRFNLRSWQATAITGKTYPNSIPHLRAMDFPSSGFQAYFNDNGLNKQIEDGNIQSILVVKGDKPQDKSKKVFDTQSTELISFIKKEYPNIKIYGAIDQYRSSTDEEISYVKEKIDAGADGFFTQPFFDIPQMAEYGEKLDETKLCMELFWGVSPVCTERSKHYWENLNNVTFPQNFKFDIESNIEFAKEALEFIIKRKTSIYFMPIKVDLKQYLTGIFGK